MDHNGKATHFTRCNCEGCYVMLYIQCNGWDW